MSERAFISIGSNVDPVQNVRSAVERLANLGRIRAISRVYENPAVGPADQPDFLNAAVWLDTELSLDALRQGLADIEDEMGRIRTADKFTARTIDLDVGLFGDLVQETPPHVVPDPDILSRGYLAVTLAELDATLPHPITGELLGEISDRMRSDARLRERTDVLLTIAPK